jgi:hypothetical protein
MKTLVSGLLLSGVLSLAAVAPANAADEDLGTVQIGTNDSFTLVNGAPPALFTDTISFDLESADAVVNAILAPVLAKNVSLALYNDTTSSLVFGCLSHCVPQVYAFGSLVSGDEYSFILTGKTQGGASGANPDSYILGNISVTPASVAGVPEASTVSMMIAGLGFLTFFGWRRHSF